MSDYIHELLAPYVVKHGLNLVPPKFELRYKCYPNLLKECAEHVGLTICFNELLLLSNGKWISYLDNLNLPGNREEVMRHLPLTVIECWEYVDRVITAQPELFFNQSHLQKRTFDKHRLDTYLIKVNRLSLAEYTSLVLSS